MVRIGFCDSPTPKTLFKCNCTPYSVLRISELMASSTKSVFERLSDLPRNAPVSNQLAAVGDKDFISVSEKINEIVYTYSSTNNQWNISPMEPLMEIDGGPAMYYDKNSNVLYAAAYDEWGSKIISIDLENGRKISEWSLCWESWDHCFCVGSMVLIGKELYVFGYGSGENNEDWRLDLLVLNVQSSSMEWNQITIWDRSPVKQPVVHHTFSNSIILESFEVESSFFMEYSLENKQCVHLE